MKPKNDKAINTRIPLATWEWLTSFGTAGGTVNVIIREAEMAAKTGVKPWKIAQSISELQMVRKRSMGELKGVFTPNEWSYIADALNGTIITPEFRCVTGALVASVEDSDRYDGLGEKWSIDVKKLTYKIEDLTAAQVDAVFTRIEEFWDSEEKDLDKWADW